MFLNLSLLSLNILIPFVAGAYIILFVGKSNMGNRQAHGVYAALVGSILSLLSSLWLFIKFDPSISGFQFIEQHQWIQSIGLDWYLGVDGVSVYFILLISVLSFLCMIFTLSSVKIYIKEVLICLLFLQSACIGAFASLNLLLFYIFFEVVLIPMYLMIGIWGGEDRLYAALKFFLYTFFGSVFFLVSLIYIFSQSGSFSMIDLPQQLPSLPLSLQKWLWLGIFISLAIKVPMFPVHTWLPDAHVQAPTAGSVLLAGILLKLGGYGVFRILLPFFPAACEYFANYVLALSVLAIIYASLVAFAQSDMKKMIAYSSVAHMGYVTAGMFTFSNSGITGAVFQMISHGVVSAALFFIVGILYERHHTKEINKYGGVAPFMPKLAAFFMLFMLASIGLPGLSGFVGELLTMLSIFEVNRALGVISALGLVVGAIYMLRLYRALMFGEMKDSSIASFADLSTIEASILLVLGVLVIYLGMAPDMVLRGISIAVESLTEFYNIN